MASGSETLRRDNSEHHQSKAQKEGWCCYYRQSGHASPPGDDRGRNCLLRIPTGTGLAGNQGFVRTKGADNTPGSSRWDSWSGATIDGGNPGDHTFRAGSRSPGPARQENKLGRNDVARQRLSLHEPGASTAEIEKQVWLETELLQRLTRFPIPYLSIGICMPFSRAIFLAVV